MEKQNNGVITDKNFKSNKIEPISNMAIDIMNTGLPLELAGAVATDLYEQGYRKVVMCKDCKYFFNEHFKACTYWKGHATTETNYCSCAKMRGE